MRANLCILLAMLGYALENTIMDGRLRSYNPVAITAIVTGIAFVVSCSILLVQHVLGKPLNFPSGTDLFWVGLVALAIVWADISFFSGFNWGASLAFATTSPVVLPIFALVFTNLLFERRLPTYQEFLGWTFAGLAVLTLINSQKK